MVRILLVTGSPLVGMYYGVELYTGYLVRTSTAVFRSFQKQTAANLRLEIQQ